MKRPDARYGCCSSTCAMGPVHAEARRRAAQQLAGAAGVARNHPRERFSVFARSAAKATGSPWAFLLAAVFVAVWAVVGLLRGWPDAWTLWMNTLATFVTFLMVFLIQNAANRHTQVVQIKLDELLASHPDASNLLIDLEDLTEQEIDALRQKYQHLADACAAHGHRARGKVSVETPEPAPSRVDEAPRRPGMP